MDFGTHGDSVGEYQTLSDTQQHYNEKHHSQNSCNSYAYDSESISKILRKTYKEHVNLTPINRKSLARLFDVLNLAISPVKLLECSLFINNKIEPEKHNSEALKFPNTTKVTPRAPLIKKTSRSTKKEEVTDDRFANDIAHLIEWFNINLRSLNHKDLSKPEV